MFKQYDKRLSLLVEGLCLSQQIKLTGKYTNVTEIQNILRMACTKK